MNSLEKIKDWDQKFCEQHVVNLVYGISNTFQKNGIEKISYVDIGANVGKVYDLLNQKLVVDRVWMIEASPLLFEYLQQKYENNINVSLFNYAANDTNGEVYFDESSMIHQINHNSDNLNFGLSKIGHTIDSKIVRSVKISEFFDQNDEIYNEVRFIKIDTESVDFNILKDLLSIITKFKRLPVIEFEVNYFVIGMSEDEAQSILYKYEEKGYNKLSLKDCHGDGILVPKSF